MENEEVMRPYQMKMATILVNVIFTPIARSGRPLDVVTAEAEKYAEESIELRQNVKEGCGIKVFESTFERHPITGWARTTAFIRMANWWFPDHFPRFTPKFTASHFPVVECRVVKTDTIVEATREHDAMEKLLDGVVIRYAADRNKLGEFDFFCRRVGRGFKAY